MQTKLIHYHMEYEENRWDNEIGSSEGLDPDVIEMARCKMAEDLGLPEESTLDQIDQAMIKKYLAT